ncbi:hypothetical protein Dip510_000063 [Elusimicrobium posterum]|uniref:hypothetical protein n=1 Tax=Elusimicrobium posterum TaxID=3116653 RepID=UPI003C743B17
MKTKTFGWGFIMRINCKHGFYYFETEESTDLTYFSARFGFKLVPYKNGFTFYELTQLPNHSIEGKAYGETGLTAKKTICAPVYEVMRANGWVFSLQKGALVEISAITDKLQLYHAQEFAGQTLGTPQAGSVVGEGQRLTDFSGFYRFYNKKLILESVTYDKSN